MALDHTPLFTQEMFFKKSALLPCVDIRRAKQSTACYHTHSHDEFSFGVIDQGAANYHNQKNIYVAGAGDTVMMNPGDAHSCNPSEGQWSYRMLFIDTSWVESLQHEMMEISGDDYLPFQHQFIQKPHRYVEFGRLFESLMGDGVIGNSTLQAETLLIEYLSSSFDFKQPNPAALDQTALRKIEALIHDQLGDNLSLSDFSDQAGISRYHLIRSFKQKYGQTPHAYQLDARIKKAKHLLQQGHSLVNTANVLGFADQSHFQRHFKKRLAVTPKQYQAFFV
jgi:AraC-like DNA-binding protein